MNPIQNYGCRVFNDKTMRERLPKDTYESLRRTTIEGKELDSSVAEVVASVMKDWAMEQGATHFTHWFQPMTNVTAGKLDAFLEPQEGGRAIAQMSSKALIKGEPDASSFPSGGLRATFEARGYTAWDPSSYAFVRDGILYIPTAFCSYTGEALDTKTPLLRSMEVVSREGIRLLRLLGNTTSRRVVPSVGAEQEYFLVDRQKYEERLDLKICGRTLMGAKPPKGQELDDHYCGRIRIRVADFMREVDRQLWELGVPAKTRHNEAAPAQHELAVVYTSANVSADQNQLIMEILRTTAKKKGLACLLHEKPFAWINGSGKHNNFSLNTDDGVNFFNPGSDPKRNPIFLLALCAMIQTVDDHGDLLRMAASCPGNDHRLGGCEAPPPVISLFLGDHLTQEINDLATGASHPGAGHVMMDMGVSTLPRLRQDDSDRNRTTPLAFTGNKFEFRMVGATQSISMCNVVLNTAIAQAFAQYSDRLEKAKDRDACVVEILADTLKNHGRIIFNGNNYSDVWLEEARQRGLPIIWSSVEAYQAMVKPANVEMFERFGVFSSTECHARLEIMLENHVKTNLIEAATMSQMVHRQVLPAVMGAAARLARDSMALTEAGVPSAATQQLAARLSGLCDAIAQGVEHLDQVSTTLPTDGDELDQAEYARDVICTAMEQLRRSCDEAETLVDEKAWPMPTYTDLLHRV